MEQGKPMGLFLLLALAVCNLCLGYAVAVYLDWGPPSLRAAWDALADLPTTPRSSARRIQSHPGRCPTLRLDCP